MLQHLPHRSSIMIRPLSITMSRLQNSEQHNLLLYNEYGHAIFLIQAFKGLEDLSASWGSSSEVGSSRTSIFGLKAMAAAMVTVAFALRKGSGARALNVQFQPS